MKLYLFLRSIIWTSVLSVVAAVASLITATIPATQQGLPIPLALISISLAILAPRNNSN
jgi:hypothetical protein